MMNADQIVLVMCGLGLMVSILGVWMAHFKKGRSAWMGNSVTVKAPSQAKAKRKPRGPL